MPDLRGAANYKRRCTVCLSCTRECVRGQAVRPQFRILTSQAVIDMFSTRSRKTSRSCPTSSDEADVPAKIGRRTARNRYGNIVLI